MATLYAQSSHNWTARVGKWNTASNGSGTTQTPTSADTLVANSFTITIDADLTAVEINTSTNGGFWLMTHGITITANVASGTTTCLSYTTTGTGSSSVIGNIYAGTTVSTIYGISMSGTGTLTVTGNVYGGGNQTQTTAFTACHGINITGAGTVIVQGGTVYGGRNGNGIAHTTGTLRVYSNIKGGASGNGLSLSRSTASTVEIGTAANPVSIGASDRPYTSNGINISGSNYTINVYCSDLFVGSAAAIACGGSINNMTISMYGGAVIKGAYASALLLTTATSGSITVNGDVYGSELVNSTHGINMSAGAASLTVNGNVYGSQAINISTSYGITSAITSTIIVNGTVYAGKGATCHGINISSASGAPMFIRKAVGNEYGQYITGDAPTCASGSYAINNISTSQLCIIGNIVNGSYGMSAVRGLYKLSSNVNGTTVECFIRMEEGPNGANSTTVSRTYGLGSSTYMPTQADVLSSITYGDSGSLSTGSLILPSASDVAYGVNVGSITGTAYTTPTDILNYSVSLCTSGTVGARISKSLTSEELAAILAAQPN